MVMEMKKKLNRKETYNKILDIAKAVAITKKGSMFIIGPKRKFEGNYELLFPQILVKHYVHEKGMEELLVRLAELDGAFLISDEGELFAMGARIKKSISLPGFGTRHAAAAGITSQIPDATAVLVSEKIGWIRVFQNGKIVLETDGSKNPPTLTEKMIKFLTDKDTALVTAAGASAAIIGVIPIVVVSGTYLAVKTASGIIRKNFTNEK